MPRNSHPKQLKFGEPEELCILVVIKNLLWSQKRMVIIVGESSPTLKRMCKQN